MLIARSWYSGDSYYLQQMKYAHWALKETYKNPGSCGTHGICINMTEGDPGLEPRHSQKAGVACFDTTAGLWGFGISCDIMCFMCTLELYEFAFNAFTGHGNMGADIV